MQSHDTLISAKWVLPVDDSATLLEDYTVAIDAGKISAILPSDVAQAEHQADSVIQLPNHILMPGLINAHTHSPMTLLRGLADDLKLMDWLHHHIWPAEQRFMDEQFVRDGMLIAAAEMIRSGTTCFNEHYFFPKPLVEVTRRVGLRATIGCIIMSVPNDYASDEQGYFAKAQDAMERIDVGDRIQFSLAPHAPYTCSDDALRKVKALAERDGLRIHMHVHETRDEVEQSIKDFGVRPLKRLEQLGLLGEHFINVHMTQINGEDMAILKDTGAHVVHCPESNLKLASGFAPIQQFLDAGVNVCLGTDGAASNNDLDMVSEMRTAALIGKAVSQDPTAVSAKDVINMATRSGARALGLDQFVGQLRPGMAADIIAVDMEHINSQPCFHPEAQLVYTANSRQVSDVWVAGQQLLANHSLTTIDEHEVLNIATRWQEKIVQHDA